MRHEHAFEDRRRARRRTVVRRAGAGPARRLGQRREVDRRRRRQHANPEAAARQRHRHRPRRQRAPGRRRGQGADVDHRAAVERGHRARRVDRAGDRVDEDRRRGSEEDRVRQPPVGDRSAGVAAGRHRDAAGRYRRLRRLDQPRRHARDRRQPLRRNALGLHHRRQDRHSGRQGRPQRAGEPAERGRFQPGRAHGARDAKQRSPRLDPRHRRQQGDLRQARSRRQSQTLRHRSHARGRCRDRRRHGRSGLPAAPISSA